MEGEGFGTSLGQALEMESSLILQKTEPENSRIKVKITNERPETHFINSISLHGFEINNDGLLYTDNYNNFHIINNKKEILNAVDINNNIVTSSLKYEDNDYWSSDLHSARSELDYEDQLVIELYDSSQNDSISLIIAAINTEIFNIVIEYLQNILGDDYASFMKAAEVDPELISILKNTLERSSLKIDIWNEINWEYIDFIYPQANFVPFRKIIKIPSIKDNNDKIKLRLRCLTDVWKLDAVTFSEESSVVHPLEDLKIASIESNAQINQHSIEMDDNLYQKLLPGEYLKLEYISDLSTRGKNVSYGVKIKGYLYEWIIDKRKSVEKSVDIHSNYSPRVVLVKEILKEMDLVLPIIYKRWAKVKPLYALHNTN